MSDTAARATITLDFQAAGDAPAKLSAMAAAANAAAESYDKMKKSAAAGGGKADNPFAGFDKNNKPDRASTDAASGLGRLTAAADMLRASYALLTAAADKAADAIDSLGNKDQLASQQTRGAVEAVVPGASSIYKFVDAITGVTNRIRDVESAFADRQITKQGEFDVRRAKIEGSVEAGQARNRASAASGYQYEAKNRPGETFDRGTYAGRVAESERDRVLAAADEGLRARRGLAAAEADEQDQARRVKAAEERLRLAEKARDRVAPVDASQWQDGRLQPRSGSLKEAIDEDANNPAGNRDNVLEQQRQLQLRNMEVADAAAEKEREILRLKESQIRRAEAESAVRKANLALMRAELENLKAREQRMAATQQRLGSMGRGDFEANKQLLAMVKQDGIEKLPAEVVEGAAKIAPQMIARLREDLGKKRAEELRGMGIDDIDVDFGDDKTIKEIRQQVDKIQAEVRVQLNIDESKLADEIAKAINDSLRGLIASLEAKAEAARVEAATGRAAAQSGRR